MQTDLAAEFQGTPEGVEAEAILRQCVHCGFCNATCPTYQLLGDELDGPRGRIYLIKQMLEGAAVTRSTQVHLDRCLTCLNCESTCPSGVRYGRLVAIGRRLVERRAGPRPAGERLLHAALREGLTSPLFGAALAAGQALRTLLPAALAAKLPPRAGARARHWPTREHDRKVLLAMGCVQPAMLPNIDSATARVLDAAGIQSLVADGAGCCGAIRSHLGAHDGGLADMRRNVDAWWPLIGAGKVEAIVVNASGCGVMVKDYGHALARDPAYADRARHVAELARDPSELLPQLSEPLGARIAAVRGRPRLVVHPPCTLQHGQRLRGGIEAGLATLGYAVRVAAVESHLCCGSAGTYSLLQPALSNALRGRKLAGLAPEPDEVVVSANIGCILHLQAGGARVRHWIEVVDDALAEGEAAPHRTVPPPLDRGVGKFLRRVRLP